MPIKGLSENRRLPRLGKIHLGVKKKSAKSGAEYPSATEYFVVPPEVAGIYGDKPTELPILIPVEDDELWSNQYYRRYSRTRGLVCKGDGVTCRRMIDTATGDTAGRDTKDVVWKEDLTCTGQECPGYKSKDCREIMNLQFLLPDVPGLGVWQVDTSSINSIRNINSAAALIRGVYGRVSMIPLTLTLEPQEVNNPDDGKRKTVRVLQLRARCTLRELMIQASKPAVEMLLPAPAEDEAPVDNAGEVIEVESIKAQAKKDIHDLWPEEPELATVKVIANTTATYTERPIDLNLKNPGEFYQACLHHFKLNKSDVDKEISMFDLYNLNQRKQAWQSIVGIYGNK
jgi:hypothetical protein